MTSTASLPVPFDDGFFDRPAMVALGRAHAAAFAASEPFPHAVFDDFLPATAFARLAAAFPGPAFAGWKRREHAEQSARLGRLERTNFAGVDAGVRRLLAELSGMAYLDFLEALTGEPGLIPDQHFVGGGLASTLRGGHLAMHVDFNRDRRRGLARVLTSLLYLHPAWDDAWGGALELTRDGSAPRSLSPRPNRLVVLANRDDGFHGHPRPLACPPDVCRQVVLTYYYRAGIDVGEARSAVFRPT